jgi:hypothetical protein
MTMNIFDTIMKNADKAKELAGEALKRATDMEVTDITKENLQQAHELADEAGQWGEKAMEAMKEGMEKAQHLAAGTLREVSEWRQMVAGPAKDTSAQSSRGDRAASLDIPSALMNPLESLPRPLSLDEVKERVSATDAARMTQTK